MLYITSTEAYASIRAMQDLHRKLQTENEELKKWIAKGPPEVGPKGAELMEEKISQNQEYMTKLLHYIDLMESHKAASTQAGPTVPVKKSWLRFVQMRVRWETADLFLRVANKGHIMGHSTNDVEVRVWIDRIHSLQNIDENIGDYLEA